MPAANSGFEQVGFGCIMGRSFCIFDLVIKQTNETKVPTFSKPAGRYGQGKKTKRMKLKNIFSDKQTKVFIVTNQDDENELNWIIEPTDFELIPEEENTYFVKAVEVSEKNITNCYLGISTPERIAETVIKKNIIGQTKAINIYDQEKTIIPSIASECFGDYELFYAKENPQIGIEILRNGLDKAINKNVIAEDLAYILRDEGRIEEAIEIFKKSEEFGPSSEYIFLELSRLYEELGQSDKKIEYNQKFKDNGGIE
ncbi:MULTISPECIES: tetratricopeptide repeat protein [Flavobacterium]|uniref:tetratricopeptide repeat protein n=1 Tax=Flavobacterium TaxID=237 RepID=UPI001FCC4AF4|nr:MULTISPECIES: tetratricopeptide repeat protein [Flavobacterium]UOK42201.1 tetratricopeptide repeat protein [Flavobacterium enshiense]